MTWYVSNEEITFPFIVMTYKNKNVLRRRGRWSLDLIRCKYLSASFTYYNNIITHKIKQKPIDIWKILIKQRTNRFQIQRFFANCFNFHEMRQCTSLKNKLAWYKEELLLLVDIYKCTFLGKNVCRRWKEQVLYVWVLH